LLESIKEAHLVEDFDCGKHPLNHWLKTRALRNQKLGFTAVMVMHTDLRVLGYYGLAPTAIEPAILPRSVKTGQPPNPVPCLLLGQLAVDRTVAGQGLGTTLLKHALSRSLAAAKLIGGRAVLVNAIDNEAAIFWQNCGFTPIQDDPLKLFCCMEEIVAMVDAARTD
jgi:GNAT superfamily N-acetyltransferase